MLNVHSTEHIITDDTERQRREADRQAALEEVRRKVREAVEAADRGELYDGEQVFRELSADLRRKRERSAAGE